MHALTRAAVEPARLVVREIGPDQLDRPTPCPDFDVRALIEHLLTWGPALVAAGLKAAPSTTYPDLDHYLDAVAVAWGQPDAWTGATAMGGHELPATTLGGMVLGEVVVHGWDLARATGQDVAWPEHLLDFLCAEVDRSGEQARSMGLYGPVVPVPTGASTLDRLIGRTGRDPAWTA
jgi:uncharacterized protein (TIGR03086 family)